MEIYVIGEGIESVERMNYLGSILERHGTIENNVDIRMNKARIAYHMLQNIWK